VIKKKFVFSHCLYRHFYQTDINFLLKFHFYLYFLVIGAYHLLVQLAVNGTLILICVKFFYKHLNCFAGGLLLNPPQRLIQEKNISR